VTKDWFHHTLD
jgi:Transposase DDE domain